MNAFERKIAMRVFGVHFAIVFLLLAFQTIKGCFRPKPKEIVTFIEFGSPAEPVDVQPVAQMAKEPAPEPEPQSVPEPPKPKTIKTREPEKPKPPKPREPEKPKWKPVDPRDIKIGKPVKPDRPTLSSREISEALKGLGASSKAMGDPGRFNDYYARVMTLFYNHWTPPGSATSATGSAIVRISIRSNGRIVKRAKIKSSGDPLYDRTVMEAVNAVSTLPKPPRDYPYDYVEVVFTLEN